MENDCFACRHFLSDLKDKLQQFLNENMEFNKVFRGSQQPQPPKMIPDGLLISVDSFAIKL